MRGAALIAVILCIAVGQVTSVSVLSAVKRRLATKGVAVSKPWLDGEVLAPKVNNGVGVKIEKFDHVKEIGILKRSFQSQLDAVAKYEKLTEAEKKGKKKPSKPDMPDWAKGSTDTYQKEAVRRWTSTVSKSGTASAPNVLSPPNKFVLHTTGGGSKCSPKMKKVKEGTKTLEVAYCPQKGANFINHGVTTLTAKGGWPHFVVGRMNSNDFDGKTNPIRIMQFFPVDVFCWSMADGQQTIQIEVIANKDQIFTADAELAEVVKELYARMRTIFKSIPQKIDNAHGISWADPKTNYDKPMWQKAEGLAGHMHHPTICFEHGDPGKIDPCKLMDAASCKETPLSAADLAKQVAAAAATRKATCSKKK
jgi:hypothetical protein